MAEANLLQKYKGHEMDPKLENHSILKTLPQDASVDLYKASQKAYNNALQHKEYQLLAYLWKTSVNSYLTVRKLLSHPNTCKLLNGQNPLMEKKNMMLLTA
ncbi:hypothetical protein O181_108840 [Austropuccinia psidii MF-1]|uniref:Uncharacterized protein n=1 Tax=Austropuccinia psidii MF-1 TaxID=1389203 RepID=A0A9Q3JX78_9BASI|nr:hypothetical protein [Austropuccinia psidii MF-1]